MFGTSKEQLIDSLGKLQYLRCCYAQRDFCDCKYGGPKIKDTGDFLPGKTEARSGEQTGCPELRQTVMILSHMTEDEFQTINDRARVISQEQLLKGMENAGFEISDELKRQAAPKQNIEDARAIKRNNGELPPGEF